MLYNAGPLDVSWAVNSAKVAAIIESFFPAQVNIANHYEHLLKFIDNNIQTGGSALVVWLAQLEDFLTLGQPVLIKYYNPALTTTFSETHISCRCLHIGPRNQQLHDGEQNVSLL